MGISMVTDMLKDLQIHTILTLMYTNMEGNKDMDIDTNTCECDQGHKHGYCYYLSGGKFKFPFSSQPFSANHPR